MIDTEILAGTFRLAAKRHFAASGLCSAIAARVAEDADVLHIAAAVNPGAFPPYLLMAAVHSLVLANTDAELARFFPTVSRQPPPNADPYPAFRDFVLRFREQIVGLIRSAHVNKTVLRRSACLRAMLVKVSNDKAWDKVHLVDIGCSVGFNLIMDRWRMTYTGAGDVGPADSPVQFSIELRGGSAPPLGDMPAVLSRTGIDLDRFDLSDPSQVRWILGSLFPDAPDTFELTKRALTVLRQHAPVIVTGDAGFELAKTLAQIPGSEPVTVMHCLTTHQMNPQQRRAMHQAMQQASTTRPVAIIGMEILGNNTTLTIAAPGDAEPTVVGEAEDDAAWMRWY